MRVGGEWFEGRGGRGKGWMAAALHDGHPKRKNGHKQQGGTLSIYWQPNSYCLLKLPGNSRLSSLWGGIYGRDDVLPTFYPTFTCRLRPRNAEFMEMTWFTDFHLSAFHHFRSHPFVATFCLLVLLYNIYTWLYPDPIMKLPVPSGARLFGGHVVFIME